MTRARYVYLSAAVFVVLYTFSFTTFNSARDAMHNADSASERSREYTSEIQKLGARDAYLSFAKENNKRPHNKQHEYAHLFGEALYRTEGLSGFSVCDAQFAFGCYHEFIGQAIKENGTGVIASLNEGCRALRAGYLACQHGIGHGILAHVGYGEETLQEAIALCSALPDGDPIGGCYGGMFMEYNVHTMWGEDAAPRVSESGSPFEPCSALQSDVRTACLYWQVQWWNQMDMAPNSLEAFKKMGDLCRTARDKYGVYRECFEGVGNITSVASDFEVPRARELCGSAGATPQEYLWCISVSANHFGQDVSKEAGTRVCENLRGNDYATCIAWAENRFNIVEHE